MRNLWNLPTVLVSTKNIDPFMLLAFLALPVIPELKLTDIGLFDVVNFEFVDLCIHDHPHEE